MTAPVVKMIRISHQDWMILHYLEKPTTKEEVELLWEKLEVLVNGPRNWEPNTPKHIDWRFRDGYVAGLLGRYPRKITLYTRDPEDGEVNGERVVSVTNPSRESIEYAWSYAFNKYGFKGKTVLVDMFPKENEVELKVRKITWEELNAKREG